jgi:hypothetical protein
MRNLRLFFLLAGALILVQCTEEEFTPIDIFEEETLLVDSSGQLISYDGMVKLPVQGLCETNLWANRERVLELTGGEGIKKARYRLRKKLDLEPNVDLGKYLQSIG